MSCIKRIWVRPEGKLYRTAKALAHRRLHPPVPDSVRHPGNGALSAINPLRLKR